MRLLPKHPPRRWIMPHILNEAECRSLDISTKREWLLTNGLGGFASGTASGINTRRYHGLLVAATQPPTGREVLLAAIDAFVGDGDERFGISSNQYPGAIYPEGFLYLREFSAGRVATWKYRANQLNIEKRVEMIRGENAVRITFINTGDEAFDLQLRPLICHKPYHENFREQGGYPAQISFQSNVTVVTHRDLQLQIAHDGAIRQPVQGWYYRFEHARESERGLDSRDDLYCPCELTYHLQARESATITASLGDFSNASSNPNLSDEAVDLLSELKEAARQFIVETPKRATIIAGYPWFTDWGRDTMISLPGICLHTGRVDLARRILRDFGSQTFHGLIPNRFVEEGETADYNTVDATLWYANAIYETLLAEWDAAFASEMLEVLKQVYAWHKAGTLYGIRVDPSDGLLTQGERGVQLTWMDAKVGDWVVTPRHGKPVEINGLWVNMLRIIEWICKKLGVDGSEYASAADKAELSFDLKFFYEPRGHYADTIDPLDVSLRPNQVIAMSLPFGPARGDRAMRALDVVTRELLTPFGLRTLGPKESGYKGRFEGPLPHLDAAYHQGTVWPWLLGPYISALIQVKGDVASAKEALRAVPEMLNAYGIGGIAEVYDGDSPQRANGCPWQAWSVGEMLRALSASMGKGPATADQIELGPKAC